MHTIIGEHLQRRGTFQVSSSYQPKTETNTMAAEHGSCLLYFTSVFDYVSADGLLAGVQTESWIKEVLAISSESAQAAGYQ